ncbi:hypothetical protein Tco_0236480 [Tanacetum coccineum]
MMFFSSSHSHDPRIIEETDNLFSHSDNFLPDYKIFFFDIKEKSSSSTTSHSDHSLPDYEAFYFDIDHQEEKSSGSTTSHSDLSLSNYESFCFDINHQEEKSSGSTTSKSDHSLPDYEAFTTSKSDHSLPDYEAFCFEEKSSGSTTFHSNLSLLENESFHFDLSIDSFPPADRSDSHLEEFADELAHIISQPEYNRFYFDIEPDPGDLTRRLEEIISEDSTKKLTSPKVNDLRLLLFDCDSIFSKIDLLVSYPSGNEDKVFDPGILLNNGIFSFTRKPPHLLIDNFMIDNCHILSEISLKIVSSICFHPNDKEIQGEFPYDREDLRNSVSISRPIKSSDLILEELTTEIGLDDSISTDIDDRYYDSEGDMAWVMERPSYRFPHMPLPRQVAYSPKVVMYHYFHPHLTSGDGFDHGP